SFLVRTMLSLLAHDSNLNGPEPTGSVIISPVSSASGDTIEALTCDSAARSGPYGSSVLMITVYSSSTSMDSTGSSNEAVGAALSSASSNSKGYLTASPFKGVPSWNSRPSINLHSHVGSSSAS